LEVGVAGAGEEEVAGRGEMLAPAAVNLGELGMVSGGRREKEGGVGGPQPTISRERAAHPPL
jgi:hypothetical protein